MLRPKKASTHLGLAFTLSKSATPLLLVVANQERNVTAASWITV
jgi:hypothetical protein